GELGAAPVECARVPGLAGGLAAQSDANERPCRPAGSEQPGRMSSRLLRNVSEAAPAGAAPAAGDAAKRRALRDPVLFVVSTLGIGGSERKIVRLANALSARGRRVALAYLNEPDALAAELDSAVPADNLRRKGK